MPLRIFVNLPVADVARSRQFYEAIGARNEPRFTDENAAAMQFSDEIFVMLLTRDYYANFTAKPIADAHMSSGALLAISRESRAEVDAMVERAAAAGGKSDPGPVQDHGFMYGRSFEDPDGHHWEPNWVDMTAFEDGPPDMDVEGEK